MVAIKIYSKTLALIIASLGLLGCAGSAPLTTAKTEINRIADLQIVDCMLPGQMRGLGNGSYLTPRRPITTTAANCRLRGGEYVEYDRADYKTALNVWMASAETGNADAQANVGEIFERGLGGSPNYEAAVIWYSRAAEQGNARAQFNLGTLYEQGFGVEKSKLQALNWYRKAWGMPEDDFIYQSAAYKEQQMLRDQLQDELKKKSTQISLLNRQIPQLQQQLREQRGQQQDASAVQDELEALRGLVESLEQDQQQTQTQYSSLPVFREPKAIAKRVNNKRDPSKSSKDLKFGKYYALIVGNQNYSSLDILQSPINDATRVAELLEKKYGFAVQVLIDASNIDIMQAINDLNDVIKENDNLLIFYAGHGSRVKTGDVENGYWLPVNADPPPTDTYWVSNEFVTRHLSRIKAKRVLVVADSCYSGLLSDAPGYLFVGDDNQYSEDYIRYKLSNKSRLLLSSGGDQPVLDNAGQGHSVFTRAFLDELESNNQILAGPELFIKIRDKVVDGAKKVGFNQKPEFKAIKGAGHEVGDFFFVPLENS